MHLIKSLQSAEVLQLQLLLLSLLGGHELLALAVAGLPKGRECVVYWYSIQ